MGIVIALSMLLQPQALACGGGEEHVPATNPADAQQDVPTDARIAVEGSDATIRLLAGAEEIAGTTEVLESAGGSVTIFTPDELLLPASTYIAEVGDQTIAFVVGDRAVNAPAGAPSLTVDGFLATVADPRGEGYESGDRVVLSISATSELEDIVLLHVYATDDAACCWDR